MKMSFHSDGMNAKIRIQNFIYHM